MKTLFISLLVFTTALFSTSVLAQDTEPAEKINYVVLTKKVPQLKPIMLTAEALKQEDATRFGDFQVIVCGPNVADLAKPELMAKYLEKAKNTGVTLVACGFSLNKFMVDRDSIPSGIKVVDNGILYNFQLQNKGYKSLSL